MAFSQITCEIEFYFSIHICINTKRVGMKEIVSTGIGQGAHDGATNTLSNYKMCVILINRNCSELNFVNSVRSEKLV